VPVSYVPLKINPTYNSRKALDRWMNQIWYHLSTKDVASPLESMENRFQNLNKNPADFSLNVASLCLVPSRARTRTGTDPIEGDAFVQKVEEALCVRPGLNDGLMPVVRLPGDWCLHHGHRQVRVQPFPAVAVRIDAELNRPLCCRLRTINTGDGRTL
jgi:hypothetical protein